MSHGTEFLGLERRGNLAVVTLNRPPVNALNLQLLMELGEVAQELTEWDDLRAVVLTGTGKFFVAGADISQMKDYTPQQALALSKIGQAVFEAIEGLPMPVIAAVNGFALGGGCELAMACDLILASSSAVFGQPEVKLGVIPGFGGTQRLVRRVGVQRARELCYSGRNVKAEEAVRIGLALEAVEGDVLEAALALAESIAENGPCAVAYCKRAINESRSAPPAVGLALERDLFGLCFSTEDQPEGMSAFLEKRSADFKGQ
jgi:enoyl-CoA hydratase